MTNEKLAECRERGIESKMSAIAAERGKINGRTAFDAARLGDAPAQEVVDEYIDYLACGIANIINIFQPEVLSIGGGISNEGQSLVDALLPIVRREQYGTNLELVTDIRIARLGNDAGIVGAALLGK